MRMPRAIEVRGARVNNLRGVDVDIPLGAFTGITGLSGSGKTSLALGVLYAEGSRRYLDALSTFTRRRISQQSKPAVDRVDHLPAAVALRQRPPVPGPRSTVGTMSEALAILRLLFSRIGVHRCPNGHALPPSYLQGISERRTCPVCGVEFDAPSAESFAFNSLGACPLCHGLGVHRQVDPAALVPDESLTLEQGAVASWRGVIRSSMPLVARSLGVRIDVPYRELTEHERDVVLRGPEVKRQVPFGLKSGREFPLNVTFENAVKAAVQIAHEGGEHGPRKMAERFFTARVCPACHGTRLRPEALRSTVARRTIAQMSALTLRALDAMRPQVVASVPPDTRPLAQRLADELHRAVEPLLALGLGYLTLDRQGSTLSTGERQRIQLAGTVLSRSTGMLFVLDEPTVGLHAQNVHGLLRVLRDLVRDGNTLVVVDHDANLLRAADHLIEIGPGAGAAGGRIVAQGSVAQVAADPRSRIAPYLRADAPARMRPRRHAFEDGAGSALGVRIGDYLNLHDVRVRFPPRALTAVTGVSGAGKSALVLDSLVPALRAEISRSGGGASATPPPRQVVELRSAGLRRVVSVDATPIGRNSRSSVATYSGVFDAIRGMFAATPGARERGWGATRFSYNTPAGRCPTCQGTGELSLDLQYLPDLRITCPDCGGRRYAPDTLDVAWRGRSIADVLDLSVEEARKVFADDADVARRLASLAEVGLGYLKLGEPTPTLSGGEAQRLRLAREIRRRQAHTLFVFDEPSVGLHPEDVRTLLGVFDKLLDAGATVIVIEHDLDVIASADWMIDMGPGAGAEGGQVVAEGTPEDVREDPRSVTGRWLRPGAGAPRPTAQTARAPAGRPA